MRRHLLRLLCCALLLLLGITLAASWRYDLALLDAPAQLARVAATPLLAWIHRDDDDEAERLRAHYWRGRADANPEASWRGLATQYRALEVIEVRCAPPAVGPVPFVFETVGAGYIARFRKDFRLDRVVADAPNEYEAMLRLAAWVGSRWDHGTDTPADGSVAFDPGAVVAAGAGGQRYWCEIAARTMVHAATALGWSARVITASRGGYIWDHAVAEVWSNEFDKWVMLDTDFNILYESEGTPLSAFEICHDGPRLAREGRLSERRIADRKPSLTHQNLLPVFRYVHVDLRNDWRSRPLPRGSPAGGDRATWWTARPSLERLLTAKVRVDDARRFDWPINHVQIFAADAKPTADGHLLRVVFGSYSPRFKAFQVSVDGSTWESVPGHGHELRFAAGTHTVRARVLGQAGFAGPERSVSFRLR